MENKKCFQCDQIEKFTKIDQDFCDLCMERNKKSDKENMPKTKQEKLEQEVKDLHALIKDNINNNIIYTRVCYLIDQEIDLELLRRK